MDKHQSYTPCGPDMQEFTDTGVNDPAERARIIKAARRPAKVARWLRWLLAAAALLAALISGLLLGRFIL
jgi:anti-sigma factor RsiW